MVMDQHAVSKHPSCIQAYTCQYHIQNLLKWIRCCM